MPSDTPIRDYGHETLRFVVGYGYAALGMEDGQKLQAMIDVLIHEGLDRALDALLVTRFEAETIRFEDHTG